MKVHYGNAYGLGESIRMILEHAGQHYENIDYTRASMPEAKATGKLEFGQVPVLEIDGKYFAQSQAVARFLGCKFGYYPSDPYEAWRVDSTWEAEHDMLKSYYKITYEQN